MRLPGLNTYESFETYIDYLTSIVGSMDGTIDMLRDRYDHGMSIKEGIASVTHGDGEDKAIHITITLTR